METPSFGTVVALSDLLDAATKELIESWHGFITGPIPTETGNGQTMPSRSADRLEVTISTLRRNIDILQEVAREIRRRS